MPNYIETDMKHDKEFFKKYINGKWEDSNKLYKEYMSWENRKFFVQEIKDFDRFLKSINHFLNKDGVAILKIRKKAIIFMRDFQLK